MSITKDNFIKLMSTQVQKDSNPVWFNKLAVLFDHNNPSNLYNENIAHLILYANDRVRLNDVRKLLSSKFTNSLIIIKAEETKRGTVKANTDTEENESKQRIDKRKHFHCYITYSCSSDVCIHKSFKSTVRELLKDTKTANRYLLKPAESKMKPIDYVRPWWFTGYNIVTDKNKYDPAHLAEWDVFYPSPMARRNAYFNETIGNKCVVKITHKNCFRVLNWLAYGTKSRTKNGHKSFVIVDNRQGLTAAA